MEHHRYGSAGRGIFSRPDLQSVRTDVKKLHKDGSHVSAGYHIQGSEAVGQGQRRQQDILPFNPGGAGLHVGADAVQHGREQDHQAGAGPGQDRRERRVPHKGI